MTTRQKGGKGREEQKVIKGLSVLTLPLSERILKNTVMTASVLLETPDGQYIIGKELGRGGSSVVYKGKMVETNKSGEILAEKDVAIKMLRTDEIDRYVDEFGKRILVETFSRQAILSVSVRHPNVMRTLDFGFEDHNPFMVMEYFPGKELNDIVAENKTLPWEWLGPVMIKVCDGLDAVHGMGIMHRNVSLPNIMVTMEEGDKDLRPAKEVKVLGFGLAKKMYDEVSGKRLAGEGMVVGAPLYMAPEQIGLGRDSNIILDQRVDIYAMGAVMYKALTGRFPFPIESGRLVEGLLKRLTEMPPPPRSLNPDVSPEVEAIIMKAMATKPEDRYQSAMDLRAAIADTL